MSLMSSSYLNKFGLDYPLTMSLTREPLSLTARRTPLWSRKFSGMGNARLSQSITKTATMLEEEYVRNLQRQIYYLEMETAYLRQQLGQAEVLPLALTSESTRMLNQLNQTSSERDMLRMQLLRRQADLDGLIAERSKLLSDTVQLRSSVEAIRADRDFKEAQLLKTKAEAEAARSHAGSLAGRLGMTSRQLEVERQMVSQAQRDLDLMNRELKQKEDKVRALETTLNDAASVVLGGTLAARSTTPSDALDEAWVSQLLYDNVRGNNDIPLLTKSSSDFYLPSAYYTKVPPQSTDFDMTLQLKSVEDRAARAEAYLNELQSRLTNMELQQSATLSEVGTLRAEKAALQAQADNLRSLADSSGRDASQLKRRLDNMQRSLRQAMADK